MKDNDFFFGKGYEDLDDMNMLTKTVSGSHFSKQINRFLAENGRLLQVDHDTSMPAFSTLLGALKCGDIGNVKILARTDQNDSVKATLSCEILLEQGIVSVVPQWCAYTEQRASEVVSTLLVPIHLANLQERTFIVKEDGELDKLLNGSNYQAELRAIFALSGYPHQELKEEYISSLEAATNIGKQGLPMTEAMEMHFNQVYR